MNVTAVEHVGGYVLRVSFDDGTSGEADLTEEIDHRTFAPLRDTERFAEAFVADGTVCWPGELDLAPERLYARAHGLTPPTTLQEARANEQAVRARRRWRR